MITVKFLSGLERRLGLSDNSYSFEEPAPVPFRTLFEKLNIQNLESITRPLFVNCERKTLTFDKALADLNVPDGESVVVFMINGGG